MLFYSSIRRNRNSEVPYNAERSCLSESSPNSSKGGEASERPLWIEASSRLSEDIDNTSGLRSLFLDSGFFF